MKIEVGESMENEVCESGLDTGKVADVGEVDDDGRPKRTGTLSVPPICFHSFLHIQASHHGVWI